MPCSPIVVPLISLSGIICRFPQYRPEYLRSWDEKLIEQRMTEIGCCVQRRFFQSNSLVSRSRGGDGARRSYSLATIRMRNLLPREPQAFDLDVGPLASGFLCSWPFYLPTVQL